MRALLLAPLLLAAACRGTWESRFESVQRAYYGGDPERAEALLREQLEQEEDDADADLLRLELAQTLQAQERYAEAAELLVAVDDELLVLDYSDAPIDALSGLLFTPDRERWHATPPERLMLNVQNMLNFLGAGEWEEAAVEARRARLQLLRADVPPDERNASRFVWGLAGICFDLADRPSEARDCFREAQTPGLEQRPGRGQGSVLVVVQDGETPVRVPGLVYLYAYGALHRLQLPVLATRSSGARQVELSVDGISQGEVPTLLDFAGQAVRRYDEQFPRLLAAAALQVVPRAWLSDAVERGLRDNDQPEWSARNNWARFGGFLAGELTAEALPADTRCWSLLPATVRARRVNLPAGTHTLSLALHGGRSAAPRVVEWTVTLEPGGFALVQLASAIGDGWSPPPPPPARNLSATPAGQQALQLLGNPSMSAP